MPEVFVKKPPSHCRIASCSMPGLFLNIYASCGRLTEAGDSHQQPSDAELGAAAIVKYSSYFSPHETRAYRPH